ncbi:major facilitator superfamily transporter [Moniliophthora roreri MCA 2997]|uniref:Major facilitator superfamily transporter n=1 Tax=Moniliophthora roreri (strain MCA 2997) TaxID=1381753 RepID=V2X8M7_MONRO|nr:major facilitator superfamily transporter [Moniliophthora roreri MCA 2997]
MSSKEPSVVEERSVDNVDVLEKMEPNSKEDVLAESDYTEEQYRRILRKIDRYLLPLIWLGYGVQQADKTSISTCVLDGGSTDKGRLLPRFYLQALTSVTRQAVFGLREDTGLVGQQFPWLSTIFYLSYMSFEFPGNYMMQRVSVGKTLAVLMFLWGIIVLCIGFARNFTHLMVLRFLQGAFECTISPSFLLIVATWYKTQEHTLRSVLTANSGMNIITNLCMYAIGDHAEKHGGLAAWKGISFFLGSLTIVLSIFSWFLLGTPREVSWISPEERRMVQARIVNNRTGTDARKRREWKKDQIIEAFTDPSTWFLSFSMVLTALPLGGVGKFGNLVYQSFGFTSLETVIFNIPRDGTSIIWFLFVGWACSRYPNVRFYLILFAIIPAFIGMLAMALLPDELSYRWIKFGMYLMTMTVNINGLMLWLFVASNVAGRTKKSIVLSILFIAYCAGSAAGPQFFRAKDAPRYIPAIIACAICFALNFVMVLSWRIYLVYLNRTRDAAAAAQGLTPEQVKELGAMNAEKDMTDRQNPHFRYTY